MPSASIIDKDGQKQVAVTDASGRSEIMSMEAAKGLEDALRTARESVDNDVNAKRFQEEEAKRLEEGSEKRKQEIIESNAKADAEGAKRVKEAEEAQRKKDAGNRAAPEARKAEPAADEEHHSKRAHK